jgi:hypothetical protein
MYSDTPKSNPGMQYEKYRRPKNSETTTCHAAQYYPGREKKCG